VVHMRLRTLMGYIGASSGARQFRKAHRQELSTCVEQVLAREFSTLRFSSRKHVERSEPLLHLLYLLHPYKINGLACYSFAIAAATVPLTGPMEASNLRSAPISGRRNASSPPARWVQPISFREFTRRTEFELQGRRPSQQSFFERLLDGLSGTENEASSLAPATSSAPPTTRLKNTGLIAIDVKLAIGRHKLAPSGVGIFVPLIAFLSSFIEPSRESPGRRSRRPK